MQVHLLVAICMNFAFDMPLNALIDSFTDTNNLKHENFSQDVNNLVQNHLEPIKREFMEIKIFQANTRI